MNEDEKRWMYLWDLHSQRLERLLDGDMHTALDLQTKQQARESKLDLEEETELMLRAYLQVLEAEEQCEQLLARRRCQAEFWTLVRAAAEARARMEEVERQRRTGGGFFAGIADALEQRNARARERLRSDDTGGGDVGAALELAKPSKAQAQADEYAKNVEIARAAMATTAQRRPQPSDNQDSGPGGP